MKFSLLIPYIPDNGRRDFLWRHLQKRYQSLMPQVELCIGVHEHLEFGKSKLINQAYQKATGDILVIVDADVIFDPQILDKITQIIDVHPWIIPFGKGIRLTREATDRLIGEGLPASISVAQSDVIHEVTTPGALMNVMTRFCFEAVSGFDERFEKYGGEDEAFAFSLDTICGDHYRINEVVYHLWHEPMQLTPEYHRVNFPLYLRYQEAHRDFPKMSQLIHERN